MFPIIPQYYIGTPPALPPPPQSSSDYRVTEYGPTPAPMSVHLQPLQVSKTSESNKYMKSERRVTAVVSSVIENNIESEEISVDQIFRRKVDKNLIEEVQVFSHNNILKCNSNNWSWLSYVHLAEDCHSYNIELSENSDKSSLKIKTVRKIAQNEKLVLWFSQSVSILLQIPHLSLQNIKGEKQYICHECQFQCEMPNPLKIHLALNCGKLSKRHLWKRLLLMNKAVEKSSNSKTKIDFPLTVKLDDERSHSAFKPYKKTFKSSNRVDLVARECSMLPNNVIKDYAVSDLNQTTFFYKQAAEMEAIVSNLGKFKQGHLCIYCGKVYSRKYGLKIHIRTHTGFKPLKCKYCLRPFGDPSNLNKHVRLHSEGDTPYKCEQCGKILVRKRDLDRHMKSRH